MPLFKKAVVKPSIQDRTAQAHALTSGALSVFSQAADDLEIAAHLKQEIALELDEQALALRYEADELEEQASVIDAAAVSDFDAADRIRTLFAG